MLALPAREQAEQRWQAAVAVLAQSMGVRLIRRQSDGERGGGAPGAQIRRNPFDDAQPVGLEVVALFRRRPLLIERGPGARMPCW